ncbi:EspA/EspE family type VII secretion system effector, partial [Mycobacterium marinum]|uniref:EspA/EspE family type VII secretion system effector n=1 Tax=Mycobacterium marinum TaxID=1781 RepID=UPI0035684515
MHPLTDENASVSDSNYRPPSLDPPGQAVPDEIHNGGQVRNRAPRNFAQRHTGSLLISLLLGILIGVREWLGDKSPERGDRLKDSASMFDDLGVRVAGLVSDGDWHGAAAHAYGARAAAQSRHATLMADLDRLIAELVSSQADALEQARKDLLRQIIITAFFLVFAIGLESGGCDETSMWAGITIWIFNALTVPPILIKLAITTSGNADDMQAVAQRVTDLVAALPTGA